VACEFNGQSEPELRLPIWMTDMDANTVFPSGEEEKVKFTIPEDC
jgi:hypothetical protein